MNKILILFTFLASTIVFNAHAVSVIVHPSNSATLNKKAIKKIFLGKLKTFPGGGQAVPVDLASGEVRQAFISKVLNKNESQLKAYWSKRIFTGKGQAPKTVDSAQEMIKQVSESPNFIGYIADDAVNDKVKVVAKF